MMNTPEEILSAIEVAIDDCEYGKIDTATCLLDIKSYIFAHHKTIQAAQKSSQIEDAAEKMAGALHGLIHQIQINTYTDSEIHDLKMNVRYILACEAYIVYDAAKNKEGCDV